MTINNQLLPRPESLLAYRPGKRLEVILQTEAAECGLACLAMVAGYHGYKADLSRLRNEFHVSSHGTNLRQLIDIAAQLELSSRPLKLELEQLDQLQSPCILHWEMNHFVVLKKVTGNKIVIHDPAVGERVFTFEQASNCFTGVALELTPTTKFETGDKKHHLSLSHFWTRASGIKRSLSMILALSLILQLFAVVSPYYLQTIIDDVILRHDNNLLTVLAIGFALLLLIEVATSLLRQYVVLNLSSKLNMQMAANVFNHLIRLPLEYFSKRHMGDIVSRFSSLNEIRELLTTGLISAFLDGLMAVVTLCVMFWYDSKLAFLVIAIVFLYALLRYTFYRPVRLLKEEQIVASAKEQTHFMESVRAIQTVKLFEKETFRQSQWQNKLADSMNKQIRISHWQFSFDTANKLLFGLENILVVYFAALAVMDNLFTVGMLYAFISYKTRFVSAMDSLINTGFEFRMLELHLNRLADIVFTPKDTNHTSTGAVACENLCSTAPLNGQVKVSHLAYKYSPLEPPVLKDINLVINPGETVAIVGASGSGKSTLIKCLMGLYKPSAGSITIDSVLLEKQPDYRKQIAAVLQDDQLLSGSIADNICCFDDKVNMEDVVKAAHCACIHDEIMAMAMQYNTLVGDMGASISGGQKQRILLARALYKNPKILFMDEATSHLDRSNENQINQHIKRLEITRIVVAHRPETIRSANRVFQLADGELSDVSNHYVNDDI